MKKTIISAFDYIALKLKVLVKEKEDDRRKLEITAKELKGKASTLAVVAKEKEEVRKKLEDTATQLATTAKGKENDRRKLEITAKEKEEVRKKLETVAEKLATTAKEKEEVKHKLEITAKEKEEVRKKLETIAEKLATTAKEKEDDRHKLEITAKELKDKAIALAVFAKEKEEVKHKLEITAEALKKKDETLEQKVIERTKDLASAKARNEAILESIGDGVVMADKEGKIIYVNKSFEEMLGWKAQEVIGKHMLEVVPQVDQAGIKVPFDKEILNRVLSGENFVADLTKSFYFIRKDKSTFPVSVIIAAVVLDEKITGTVETFRDITKEKDIDKTKSEFASLASHQLRTPLGIMKWYLEALKAEDYFHKATKAIQNYIEVIYKSNERELSLVRELLSVSRIDEGKVGDTPKLVDLIQVVTGIVAQMQLIASEKKIILHLTVHDLKIPSVNIDLLRFHEVIENLIGNAIEYSQGSGKVEVSVEQIDDIISLSVQDTGMIISAEDQKKLFTKFFRSQKAIAQNPEGSGLGLYVVKSYVEGWGGKVFLESTKKTGTTFRITIPMSPKSSQQHSN